MLSEDKKAEIRQQAERLARDAQSGTTGADESLVYELRTHQIELEMQNDELVKSERELTQARNRYESLFENAPVGYFVLNQEGVILATNNNGADLLAARRKGLVRKPFIVFLPQEFHTAFFAHLSAVFSEVGRHTTEMRINTRESEQIWCRLESVQHFDEEGIPQCLTAVVDITDRRRIEDDLIIAKEEAVAASRAKSVFLANMSHEIRTPMNGILAMSEIAMESVLTPEQRDYISAIHVSARSLLSIINDILDLSRIEADKIRIESAPFSIRDTVQECLALFQPMVQEKSLTTNIVADPNLPDRLIGDRNRFRQVLLNLVGNAVKFTQEGSVTIRLGGSRLSDHAWEVTCEVSDTGIGIPEALRNTIFDSFTQAENAYDKRYQGAGLGLTISRRLARLMGGQLFFNSSAGEGSTFFFTLPLLVAGPDDEIPTDRLPDLDPAETKGKRILVAEDNAINTLVIRTILEKAGLEVWSATSGAQALEYLEAHRFDLVFMDISMPELDGLEATRRIRSGEVPGLDPAIPVIAISAHAMSGDREAFAEAGMDDYLGKPFSRLTVLETVRRHLSREGV